MRLRHLATKALLPAGIVFALGISACAYDPYYVQPSPYPHSTYVYPYDYDYYYYPNVRVYFQYSTGYYYYRVGDRWERSHTLPRNYYLDPRTRVKIRVQDPKPYVRDNEHYRKYTPPQKYQPQPRYDRQEREHNRRTYETQSKERNKYIQEHEKRERKDRR